MEQTLALASAAAGAPLWLGLAGLRLRGFLRRVGRVVVEEEGRRGDGEDGERPGWPGVAF